MFDSTLVRDVFPAAAAAARLARATRERHGQTPRKPGNIADLIQGSTSPPRMCSADDMFWPERLTQQEERPYCCSRGPWTDRSTCSTRYVLTTNDKL